MAETAETTNAPELSAEEAHARSLMSPEELEALATELDDDAEAVADEDEDEDDGEDEDEAKDDADEDEDDGSAAADGEAGDDAHPAEDAQPAEAADAAVDDAGEEGGFVAPKMSYVLPEDHQVRREALDASFAELERKFDEGDLQRAEYAAESRKLMREQSELDRQEMRAEAARDAYQAQVSAVWKAAFDKYVAWASSPEGGGLKYGTEQQPNEHLRAMLGAEADKIAAANPNLAPAAVWRKADAVVRDSLGLPAVAQAKAVPAPADDAKAKAVKAEKAKARTPDRSVVPQNLGGVTGEAAESDVSGNEFAYLDKLQGEAFEAAFAKLSPAKREAYMALP